MLKNFNKRKSFLSLLISLGVSLSLANSQVCAMQNEDIPFRVTLKIADTFQDVDPSAMIVWMQKRTFDNSYYAGTDEFSEIFHPFGENNTEPVTVDPCEFQHNSKVPFDKGYNNLSIFFDMKIVNTWVRNNEFAQEMAISIYDSKPSFGSYEKYSKAISPCLDRHFTNRHLKPMSDLKELADQKKLVNFILTCRKNNSETEFEWEEQLIDLK